MKPLLLIFTLLFTSVFLTSPSFAKWTKLGKNKKETTYYVDFERISRQGRYVHWWELGDRLKPNASGYSSNKAYKKGDCKLFRYKYLSHTNHIKKMGGGNGETVIPKNSQWYYPSPNSSIASVLKSVCSR
jgi:hypothetical protein